MITEKESNNNINK